MSSIIKVDQIQLSDGSTPTAGDLGLNTSGTIVQTVVESSNTTGTSTSTSKVSDGLTASITPTSLDNYFLIYCFSGCSVAGGYAYFDLRQIVGSTTIVAEAPWGSFSGSPQQLNSFTIVGKFQPTTLTQHTFALYGSVTSGGTRYIHYSSTPRIIVQEIAG